MVAVSESTFLAAIIPLAIFIVTGFVAMIRLLWLTSAQWTRTGDKMEYLGAEIRDLVLLKEKEHARIEIEQGRQDKRMERLEDRVERHEQWHSTH